MKYNKSEIMKSAWSLFRADLTIKAQNRRTFSECLKAAWNLAKSRVQKAAESAKLASVYSTKKFYNGMEITINYVTYTLTRWTRYGKDRVYVTGGKNRRNNYVDLMSDYNTVYGDQLVSIIRSLAY